MMNSLITNLNIRTIAYTSTTLHHKTGFSKIFVETSFPISFYLRTIMSFTKWTFFYILAPI